MPLDLEARVNVVYDQVDEVKLRLVRIEDAKHGLEIQHTALAASVDHMVERQGKSEELLKEIHASVLKSEGAVQALKESKYDTHGQSTIALGKKSYYVSIVALFIGSSVFSKLIEVFLRGH